MLDLTSHDGPGHTGLLEHLDPGSELAKRNAMNLRDRRTRGLGFQFGKRFFLERDDSHLVTGGASGLEDEKGKPAIAGNESEVHATRPRARPRYGAWRAGG